MMLYVGTYRNDGSPHLHYYSYDAETGALGRAGSTEQVVNPAFLARHPTGRFLYCVSEVASMGDQPAGGVAAFEVDAANGSLRFLNIESALGPRPCHISLDRSGRVAFVSNYRGESIAALPIHNNGSLAPAAEHLRFQGQSINPHRQLRSHPHSCNADPANRFVIAADLGTDRLMAYALDAERCGLTPNDPPWTAMKSGAGPRHFKFHPDGRHAYVINELADTVTAFDYDPMVGKLTETQTIGTLPDGYGRTNATADLHVSPDGRFLYGSNRGHDSIVIYAIDQATGRLALAGFEPTRGICPRNFAIDPAGRYLHVANQKSDSIVTFAIDATSGLIEPTGQVIAVQHPVCVLFNEMEASL